MKPYYEHAGITIFHGDCREILPSCDFQVCVSDPPFGVTEMAWDSFEVTREVCVLLADLCKGRRVIFGVQPRVAELIVDSTDFSHELIWWKNIACGINGDRVPVRQHELIEVFGRGTYNPIMRSRSHTEMQRLSRNSAANYARKVGKVKPWALPVAQRRSELEQAYPGSVIAINGLIPRDPARSGHPSEKPIELLLYLVKTYSSLGDCVLDPFMGSGTSLLAAKQLGRSAIGIEIEEEYCEIAAKRLSQEVFTFEAKA